MRTRYSPLNIIFGASHEQLIHWHQICGRTIMILLLLHGTWYINYFVQNGILTDRLQHRYSITGLLSLLLMAIIVGTSLEKVRRWSYRIFIYCHISIGLAIWPILLLHAKPLRLYAVEALALFILDRVLRYLDTVTEPAMLTPVPRTELLKISFSMTPTKLARFQAKPGQHVYLSIPSNPTCSGSKSLLSNPFTVSDVTSSEIALVLRARQGPTTQKLRKYADYFKFHPLISIEGPYGCPPLVAELVSNVDRILLVAGGIGATFILPIYRALQEQLELEAGDSGRLNLVWALRTAAEASWATDSEKQAFSNPSNVRIYLTRHRLREDTLGNDFHDGGIEMDELRERDDTISGVKALAGRLDLKDIVDEIFSYHARERIAVIFCGPGGMGRELRAHVGQWVSKGRDVVWHEESFGW